MDKLKWDIRFLRMAKEVSTWSKDPSTKVGAVIADGKRFKSAGFNGFPECVEDKEEDYNNREVKLSKIVHAEANAIGFMSEVPTGFTLYTYPFMPCSNCAQYAVGFGIKRVVSVEDANPRWQESFEKSKEIFKKANVELVLYKKEDLGL